jgi:alkylation response protein AidB-like acyl-CoA dehydrogenase
MTNYFAPIEDLAFLLSEVLELERLRALPAFAALDADIVKSVLTEGARFSQDVLSPINAPGDRVGSRLIEGKVHYPPGFADAFARYAADGWLGMDLPESVGGQGLPRVLQAAFAEMTNGANLAFSMLPVTIRAAARLLLAHGDAAVVEKFVPAMVKGDCAATIVISEPQAGSDVGRIRTLAVPKADGSYRLSGTKCFISNADNDFSPQIAHIVLARTPGAAAGTRGISLFLVPKYLDGSGRRQRNGVQVLRIEHKMGLNASPTCVLEFTDAHAFRIGSEGRGLNAMFVMVNTMRLEVAMQGVAIGSAAMSRAIRYSFERVQPDVVRMLLTMRARTEALRALTLEAALQLDLSEHEGDDERRRNALGFAQWLLPICKAYASDLGFETANAALQVFGGYGYIKETGV